MDTAVSGFLLVDKPIGMTSHDVVDRVRRITNVRKVGHTGTLDPGASGVLLVLVGRKATRLSESLKGLDKSYMIQMKLGYRTDSLDQDGTVTQQLDVTDPLLTGLSGELIESTIHSFVKSYEQTVPLFSAVKIDGTKLYQHGYRERHEKSNTAPDLPARTVTIHSITDIDIQLATESYPEINFVASVSSGTYTRCIVRDIGDALGVPSVQTSLRRTQVGPFCITETIPLDQIGKDDLREIDKLQALA